MKQTNYDLEERLAVFAENVIDLLKQLKITALNRRIVDQLIGASGSSGANYCEANEAESVKDFIHKIGIVKKELKESMHWMRLLSKTNPELEMSLKINYQENQE